MTEEGVIVVQGYEVSCASRYYTPNSHRCMHVQADMILLIVTGACVHNILKQRHPPDIVYSLCVEQEERTESQVEPKE